MPIYRKLVVVLADRETDMHNAVHAAVLAARHEVGNVHAYGKQQDSYEVQDNDSEVSQEDRELLLNNALDPDKSGLLPRHCRHRYAFFETGELACPGCQRSLTSPDSVLVHFADTMGQPAGQAFVHLSSSGNLQPDTEGSTARGMHSSTRCSGCDLQLDRYEIGWKEK